MNTLYAAYKAAKSNKGKLIYDSHELYVDRNKLQKPSAFYKFLSYQFEGYFARKCDAVITVGDKIAELLQSRYRLKNNVFVVMNAPSKIKQELKNDNHNKIREALHIPENYKLLIYTGSITFNRGLENLVRSLKFLPNMYLVMMGYGKNDFKKKLLAIANENNVSDRFSFFGPVPSDEVTAYTQEADLGIAPIINACLSYYYCAPNKIFEYLLGGIPVVASNFPEMEKIVKENNIGTTFNPEKPESIAKAVKEVFSDDERYKQLKANTKIAAEKYNWENEEKKLLNIYKNL
jgi:glycosyltransferase involved in cell wall biosynthesis